MKNLSDKIYFGPKYEVYKKLVEEDNCFWTAQTIVDSVIQQVSVILVWAIYYKSFSHEMPD